MAGRPPKPTGLKLVTGNPGKRALNKQEPDPEYLADLAPPTRLSEAEAEVWRELAPPLRAAKVLTTVDVLALEMLCIAVARYRFATQKAPPEGGILRGENGLVMNPWLIVQSMTFKQATGLMRDFGMTPAARSRVMIQPQGDLFGNAAGGASGNKSGKSYFT